MKFFIAILLTLICVVFAKTPPNRINRANIQWRQFIIGGTEVEDFSQFAYQLSMRYVEIHVCGASIIALHWALSAAHCFENNVFPDMISFRAGSRDRFEGGIVVNAEQFFIHPLFDRLSYDFDAAVVRTIEPFIGKDVEVISLIPMGFWLTPGTIGTISGWGIVDEGHLAINLQKLDLEIWDQHECFVKWFGEITSNMFCAGGEPGYDSCNGDSGGAMVVDGVQVGIVSTGATTCGINFPGVYTNITHPSIRAFILHRTGV
ncbi:CLUMA_CG012936, isoform A [Clunio marinus]|uniref:CLUMA_CG012936, isoform A n=1 Tax=Clunio marinus TaxID=568069 RepID=A0A1J1IHE3_9DIPT|nr:CLUMA_CG012936, isoform A [Clunio marinus]